MKLAEHAGVEVHHAEWRDLRGPVMDAGNADALIVDAPYSARTHAGSGQDGDGEGFAPGGADGSDRRTFNYGAWSRDDVEDFTRAWHPLVRGWMVSITDHVLAPAWEAAMLAAGRYVFAPLPFYSPGSSVRIVGDGPSSWTCWIVVSRPRCEPFSKWGTLPGGYQCSPERGKTVLGGKPLWLMERLVEDYSRPGQLVVDPCVGGGTTLVACQRTGRRGIGGDALLDHAQKAVDRIRKPAQMPMFAFGEKGAA